MANEGAWLQVDWQKFDPWRVQLVRHRVHEHPLAEMASVIELSQRLEATRQVRTHSDDARPETSFQDAPKLHPNPKSAKETLSNLEQAHAWTSLMNVQTDAVYRRLVDTVLDDVRPALERRDPGMCYRAGWIFLASPFTVTPFHMDVEHNFILQLSGKKRLYVWEPDDTVAVSEEARDLFLDTHDRKLIGFREALRARAHVFEIEPGIGAYMPSTAPHLVENYDNVSMTASFTFYTDSTRHRSLLHKVHSRLRRRGMHPPAVGARPMRDAIVLNAARAALALKAGVRRTLGAGGGEALPAYAVHRRS